ncbi:PspA/IM30 family protein [Rhodobacteraceae bacterium N5(2021)]|uniref:PspA/IM30 family protein n=1 Tax=Gymnodinialimonas phycosphaerae TaxID=2841589 RepID=A0A975TY33_9RHOB|nr:PspA/IM30 family protein [Gymnodinialimonas phycosphaerae]MBY4892838.1 PspA/IM30 family protein [Gymnodinialimonas phycosphaerae]
MFRTLTTLVNGANARAEERVRDHYSIELIDQKIREAEASLKAAKFSLASLIQRERSEARQVDALSNRIADLTSRAKLALADGREDMATEAAGAIAQLENELKVRHTTVERLETRILKLRHSVEGATRRITDLKQGAIAARAAKKEADIQRHLGRHVSQDTAFEEAEELIARVLNRDDPFEQTQILREIDEGLDRSDMTERLSDTGYGDPLKSTAADVMQRLRANT